MARMMLRVLTWPLDKLDKMGEGKEQLLRKAG